MQVVQPTSDACFKCDECQTSFARRGQLNRHLKTHDDPSICFTCEACSYKSFQKSNVVLHAKAKHGKRQKVHQGSGGRFQNDLALARHNTDMQPDSGPSSASSTAGALGNDFADHHQQRYDPPPYPPPGMENIFQREPTLDEGRRDVPRNMKSSPLEALCAP